MKRTIVTLIMMSIGLQFAMAQNLVGSFLPDSIRYVMPAFEKGTVIYKDGRSAAGIINICVVDQTVHMKDKSGKVMQVSESAKINRVNIGKVSFIRAFESFVRLTERIGDVHLGYAKVMIIDDAQESAYGGKNYTNSIESMSGLYDANGQMLNFTPDMDYEIRVVPYFYDGLEVQLPSKGTVNRLMSGKKDVIKAYLKENKVNFDDYDSVCKLFNALK